MNTNPKAKTILCYGDSNTWGNIPRTDERHPADVRWPGALQDLLGKDYEVISEGLCGRTLVSEEPGKPHRTGITHLCAILESSEPTDLLIIMLGTNDAKTTFDLTPEQIADHLAQTVEFVQKGNHNLAKTPDILIICPPAVIEPATKDLDQRMLRAPGIFQSLPGLYKAVAQKYGCRFLNAGDSVSASSIDGYHMDADAHKKLAQTIAGFIS